MSTAASKHALARLKREKIAWLATSRNGRPHVVPVWFLWDGSSLLVYSLPGQKVTDIEANPNVALHLNTDVSGDDVVRIQGTASVARDQVPAYKVPAYVRKYSAAIKGYNWTPKSFSEQYHVPIRIKPTRFSS